MNCMAIVGHDKAGRPNFFCKVRNYLPGNTTIEAIIKGSFHIMVKLNARMPAHIDEMNMIMDMEGMGYSNFDMKHHKPRHALGECLPERTKLVYIFNYGMIFNAIMTMMWPLIPEHSKKKFTMCKVDALLEVIDADQLPAELGGTAGYSLDEAYKRIGD